MSFIIMDDSQTVTMTREEWQQIVGIIARATSWPIINKLFTQIMQVQETSKPPYNGEDRMEAQKLG